MLAGLVVGEREQRREPAERRGIATMLRTIWAPFVQFFERQGAIIVLIFILIHKVGDTLANLTFRLLFDDLRFTNDEIAAYDVGVGFWAYLVGIFVGGWLYSRIGMKRSLLLSLVLMMLSNLTFPGLAAAGHTNLGMAGAIGVEDFARGFGGAIGRASCRERVYQSVYNSMVAV